MKRVPQVLVLVAFVASAASLPGVVLAHGEAENAHAGHAAADAHAGGSFGHGADPATATRTVTVTLGDNMRFAPDRLAVKQGEVLRIHVVNSGKVDHEFILGDEATLAAHAEMMKRMPGMVHRDANTLRLGPGQQGDIAWAFTEAGTFLYVCQIPGHREAGMQGTVVVTPAGANGSR